MSLYRASPTDGVAWITGASSGIGRQLALDLAEEGYTVAATARGKKALAELVDEGIARGRTIIAFACDMTDENAVRRTVLAIEKKAGPIALSVFCAGNYLPVELDKLTVDTFVKTYEINVFGVVNGLVPVLEAMRRRGCGQIAVVGSVTSYFGLPTAAAYGASKAALNNMVWALKYDLDPVNIRIQIVNPGFIETPLTEKNAFAMPALMPVDRASRRFVDGIKAGGTEITFPRRFTWALKVLCLLPAPWIFAIYRRSTGWNKREPASAPK